MNVVMIVFAVVDRAAHREPGRRARDGRVRERACCSSLFQMPVVMRLGLFRWPRWRPAAEGVRRIGKLMLPGIFGSSMAQVSLLLDTQIASFLDHRQHRVAVLRRPAHGVSARRVQHRARDGHPAGPVGASRAKLARTFTATLDWALRLVILLVVVRRRWPCWRSPVR